jgi:hypothetical protein
MKNAVLITLILVFAYNVRAQIEEMINPSDLKQQTIITEPATLHKGFFRPGIIASYGINDRVFDESGKKSYLLETSGWLVSWDMLVSLQYGLIDRLEIMTNIPYRYERIFHSQFIEIPGPDSSIVQASKMKGAGLGDISLGAEFQIIKEDERKPSLSTKVLVTIPTGRKNPENVKSFREYDRPTGSGETTLDFILQLRKIIYPYSLTVYSSYIYHFESSKIFAPYEEEISFKSGDRLYLGGSFNVHLNDWIALMNEIAYFKWWDDEYYGITLADQGISNRWGIYYQPALYFQIRKFRFYETVQLPLYGKNYIPADPSYTLGLFYTF